MLLCGLERLIWVINRREKGRNGGAIWRHLEIEEIQWK